MSDITKENVSVETDDKVNAIREDDEMQNTINEKIDITTQGSSEETRTDLVTADAGNANSVGHPTITIKYQGLEWHLDRHNFMRNSELAVTTFGRDTKCYPHNEIMKVPDNAKGVSAQALDLMTNYFNDGAEAPAQWLTCHGGTEHKGPTWMSKIQKNPNALQDMPEHFTTAAYFQSRSLVVLLQLAASRSFIALICSKGRQQSLPSYALYTKAICEALGAAFDPSRCPYKVEGAREVAQVDGEAEKDEVGCEHQQPDTLCADEVPAPPPVTVDTSTVTATPTTNDENGAPPPPPPPPPPPFWAIPLHPALEPLHEVYLKAIYTNRFDLLNNHDVLLSLSAHAHLSASFLRHLADHGGVGIEYMHRDGTRSSFDVYDPAVLPLPRPTQEQALSPSFFYQFRMQLLNDAGWLRWVAEHEHLMALFWAEMAYKGQLSYGGGLGCAFLRWDRLEGESKWRTSPY